MSTASVTPKRTVDILLRDSKNDTYPPSEICKNTCRARDGFGEWLDIAGIWLISGIGVDIGEIIWIKVETVKANSMGPFGLQQAVVGTGHWLLDGSFEIATHRALEESRAPSSENQMWNLEHHHHGWNVPEARTFGYRPLERRRLHEPTPLCLCCRWY